jgi:glyoxylase-like metal-dependent hydrolase (beta-lactamase superfamily II)
MGGDDGAAAEGNDMAFLTEPVPPRGVAMDVLPGIRRIVAANPGPFTYHGTNTYLVDGPDGTWVLDPGPDDAAHVAHILAASGGKVARIVLSHTHPDHLGAVPALKAATGAKVWSFRASQDPDHAPDVPVDDGDDVGGWTAIHTPGHAGDHLCFARDGVVFTADHIMSWSTSVVSPPHGNMKAYFESMRRMLARGDTVYLPGHGPKVDDPIPFARALLAHRAQREAAIANALVAGPKSSMALVEALYVDLNPKLKPAAQRTVIAHLEKLRDDGRATAEGDIWKAA